MCYIIQLHSFGAINDIGFKTNDIEIECDVGLEMFVITRSYNLFVTCRRSNVTSQSYKLFATPNIL